MSSHVRPQNTLGVLTLLDYPLLATIELAEMIGVPHPGRPAVERCRSKDLARVAIGHGPDQPAYCVIDKASIPESSPVGYPCVVKPVDDSGSVGVHICTDHHGFSAALAAETDRDTTLRGFPRKRRWIVEEYVEGPEFSAELICLDGHWHLLGIVRKILGSPSSTVAVGQVFPAKLEEPALDSIEKCVFGWLEAVGLAWGAAHVEFRLTPRGPVLIEINPRLGGALISELIRHATALDVVDLVMRQSCGLPLPSIGPRRESGAAAILLFHQEREGTIVNVTGEEQLRGMPGLLEFELPSVGQSCHPLRSDYDRLGHVIARGADEHEALRNAKDAVEMVSLDIQPR